jgi:hypothetical protein
LYDKTFTIFKLFSSCLIGRIEHIFQDNGAIQLMKAENTKQHYSDGEDNTTDTYFKKP